LLNEIEAQYREHKKLIEEKHQIMIPDASMPSIKTIALKGSFNNGYDYSDYHTKSQSSASPLFSYMHSTFNQAHINHANVVKYVMNKQEDVEVHHNDMLRIKHAPST
jgi:hypothetical protein